MCIRLDVRNVGKIHLLNTWGYSMQLFCVAVMQLTHGYTKVTEQLNVSVRWLATKDAILYMHACIYLMLTTS